MLHLVSERALRKLTACVSVVIIASKCVYFMRAKVCLWLSSHKCQTSDWPLDMFRDFLTSRPDTFPDNTSKIWNHWRQHICAWSHACSPGKELGREQINCEQPGPNTLGGCYSTCSFYICIHSEVWKSFLFCPLPFLKVVIYFTENIWKNSLCLLHRILSHILKIPGFTIIPGLRVLLGTLKTGESFQIYLVLLRFYYAFHLSKWKTLV